MVGVGPVEGIEKRSQKLRVQSDYFCGSKGPSPHPPPERGGGSGLGRGLGRPKVEVDRLVTDDLQ